MTSTREQRRRLDQSRTEAQRAQEAKRRARGWGGPWDAVTTPMTPRQYSSILARLMYDRVRYGYSLSDAEFSQLDRDVVGQAFLDVLYHGAGVEQPEIGDLDALRGMVYHNVGQRGGEMRRFTQSLEGRTGELGSVDFEAIAGAETLGEAVAMAGASIGGRWSAQPLGPNEREVLRSMEPTPEEFAAQLEERYGKTIELADGSRVAPNYRLIAIQPTLDAAMTIWTDEGLDLELLMSGLSGAAEWSVAEAMRLNPELDVSLSNQDGSTTSVTVSNGQVVGGSDWWEQKAPESERLPLGTASVDPGFVARVPKFDHLDPADRAAFGKFGNIREVSPTFFLDDVPNFWLQWAEPGAVAGFQARLVEAGLMEMGDFRPGLYDEPTMASVQTLFELANDRGDTSIEPTLKDLIEFPRTDPAELAAATGSSLGAHRPPDINTLVATVKEAFRSQLRREPRRGELDQFVAQLKADYRQAYLNETAADAAATAAAAAPGRALEAEFIADPDRFIGGQVPQAAAGEAPPEGLATDEIPLIDPMARFAQRFEEATAAERDRRRQVQEAAARSENIQSAMFRMRSAVGRRGVDSILG